MEEEIWKDIFYYNEPTNEWIDYRGLYQVSNFGRVRSLKRTYKSANGGIRYIDEHIVKMYFNHKGYLQVFLYKEGKRKTVFVHRLVAFLFIPNYSNKPQIDHIDTNKSNNNENNLRWVTNKENVNNPITKTKMSKKIVSEATKHKQSIAHKGKIPKQCSLKLHKLKCKKVNAYDKDGNLIKKYNSLSEASKDNNISISAITKSIKRNGYCRKYKWKFISL